MDAFIRELGRIGPGIAFGLGFLLFVSENAFPLRRRKSRLFSRIAVNAFVTGIVFLIGTYIVRRAALGLSFRIQGTAFGILNLVSLPFAAHFALGFLMMDLSFYYWHRVNHTVPLLWRFHVAHHIDPDMDVTTSFRFHAVEALFSVGFRALQVGITGVAPVTYVTYELAFTCVTMFQHSNLRMPIRLERVLNKVLVTPRMHGIHHSMVREEDNSNYSVIFRWWDTLHGSLNLGVRQSDVTIGIPAYLRPEDNRLRDVLVMPFRGQRDYWLLPDGTRPARTAGDKAAGRNLLME